MLLCKKYTIEYFHHSHFLWVIPNEVVAVLDTHDIISDRNESFNKLDLEKWIPNDIDYAFLDWKNETSLANEQFFMRALGHGNINRDWQTRFDGVFYIKEMQPAHRLKAK